MVWSTTKPEIAAALSQLRNPQTRGGDWCHHDRADIFSPSFWPSGRLHPHVWRKFWVQFFFQTLDGFGRAYRLRSSLQMLVACGGLEAIVELISSDYFHNRDLVPLNQGSGSEGRRHCHSFLVSKSHVTWRAWQHMTAIRFICTFHYIIEPTEWNWCFEVVNWKCLEFEVFRSWPEVFPALDDVKTVLDKQGSHSRDLCRILAKRGICEHLVAWHQSWRDVCKN